MPLFKTLLSLLFITLSAVHATHHHTRKGTLRFTTRFNLNQDDGRTLPERDRAHVRSMVRASHHHKRSDTSVGIANDVIAFVAQVGVGEPARNYTVLIDTGSSNTWVNASTTKPYNYSRTSINTGNLFAASYGSGNVSGEEYLDTVTLSSHLVIKDQSIGVVNFSIGVFQDIDGILGVGPIDLTRGTVNNTTFVPTVLDNLYSQGKIKEEVLGIYYVPTSVLNNTGELTFGGYDSSVITSPVKYVPLTATVPASKYWGVNQSVSYNDKIIQSNGAGVIDTGTTLVLLATDAFWKYKEATGAVLDNSTGLLTINTAQYANLKTLSLRVGDACLDLRPNAQIWPRSLNTAIGGNASAIYLIVNDLGEGLAMVDFINGYTFLERFYSVYDTTNKQLGFARTAYTDSVIN